MRGNGIEPTIEGPYYALPCPCGCKSWMVNTVADVQGVITQGEAAFVADMLNALHRGGPIVASSLTSSAAFLLRERGL